MRLYNGGGIEIDNAGADPIIEMCLFTGNQADEGGAIRSEADADGGTFQNTTVTTGIGDTDNPGLDLGVASTVTNLISYGNVTAGMADENTFTGTTPTYSIYYYDETAGDTPGAGCLDSASNDPLFVSTRVYY